MKRSQLVLASAMLIVLFYLGCQQADNPIQSEQLVQERSVLLRESLHEGEGEGYTISGRVFVDANENKSFDQEQESGLACVAVIITSPQDHTVQVLTNSEGKYKLKVFVPGVYKVKVPLTQYDEFDDCKNCENCDDVFNDRLADFFEKTTRLSRTIEIIDHSKRGIDFGFKPDADAIIQDLETGDLQTNGRDFKFWRKQLLFASKRGKGNPEIDTPTLQGYLNEIEELFLSDPYQFDDDNEFHEAWEIVQKNKPKTPLERLKKELLVGELNYVHNESGIAGEPTFSASILAWGESLVADEEDQNLSQRKVMLAASPQDIDDATRILTLMNRPSGPGD